MTKAVLNTRKTPAFNHEQRELWAESWMKRRVLKKEECHASFIVLL